MNTILFIEVSLRGKESASTDSHGWPFERFCHLVCL
jgi:hypothetical protein